MTASGLPAVLIKLATSGTEPGESAGDILLAVDLDDMFESMEAFLGALPAGSVRETTEGPAIVGREFDEAPPEGFWFTTESDTLRVSFANRGDRAGLVVSSAMPNVTPNVGIPAVTHSELGGSGVDVREESLS